MKRLILKSTVVLGLGILLVSCGKIPQAEMDAAKAAIETARAAQAEIYVPEAFTAVMDSLNSAMANVESQKSKWFKNYSSGKEKLVEVANMANALKDQAELKKAEVKAEVESLVAEVKALTEENKKLVTEAPKGKEGKAALEAMKSEISVIEAAVAETGTMMERDEIMPAQSKIRAAKDQAASLNAELKEVIAKYNKR
ncbi:MAG: hypothetical protein JXA03_14905 [Bacteroidales bacterium]|nr:hypothetical protein [Bacteroidales bacterium]